MNKIIVSIVVPVYNGSKTMVQCMESLLSQDYERDLYEIIIVDDGSSDGTASIAKQYSDKIITHSKNLGLNKSRFEGMKIASGGIIINTDADVLLPRDTLSKVANFFSKNSDISALTGLLSKETSEKSFFGQYKNLYMNYIFRKLPERVSFLYGSINAVRREAIELYPVGFDIGEDTSFGQMLVKAGKKIAFLRNLEVMHLKKYTFFSFIKNDFSVPFYWAKIFIKYGGLKQLGRDKTGFAHSPKGQIISVILAPFITLMVLLDLLGFLFLPSLPLIAVSAWAALNFDFITFLIREKGVFFGLAAIFIAFFDNLVMASGILCGFFTYLKGRKI